MASYLLVPAAEPGRGSGHLTRSIALLRALRSSGAAAYLLVESSASRERVLEAFSPELPPDAFFGGDPASVNWTCIILDRFRTARSEFFRLSRLGPLVGIDEGGRSRAFFDYLIDIIPGLPQRRGREANLVDPGLLDLPVNRRPSFAPRNREAPRVLVSFGGEDRAGLTLAAVKALSASGLAIEALVGPLNRGNGSLEVELELLGARVLKSVPNLKERLADYDLLVTQYGLTAFEAAHARVPVLLLSPTRYHEALSRARGFVSVGVGQRAALILPPWLHRLGELGARTAGASPVQDGGEAHSLFALISSLTFPTEARCPLCASRNPRSRALARFSGRTYRRCPRCGLLHLVRPDSPPITYAHDYFFRDYKAQYGRTYLEDFPSLERSGSLRASRILALLDRRLAAPAPERAAARPAQAWRLVDIGSAYGPFLSAARKAGFSAHGLEVSGEAVAFVKNELGIPAIEGSFPATDPVAAFGGGPFNAVTLWYVIEHLSELGPALDAAREALLPGGIFAFSTPSASGISARARFRSFLENSPEDHLSLWEPGRTARLLRRHGFALEKIVVTGHHPERFPGLDKADPSGLRFRLALLASRLFRLGDTYEVYARRMTDD